MDKPAAIQGDYVDLRFVKTRKVCQITVEIPIEQGAAFVAAFGTPSPATGVPVALARIDLNVAAERKGGRIAQRAGILCGEVAFGIFLQERYAGEGSPVEKLRNLCGVNSRADLDHNDDAARQFAEIEANYKAWLMVPA